MAERDQQPEMEAKNMMNYAESVDTSSGDLLLRIHLPQQLLGKEKKMKITISRDATVQLLREEIANRLQNIKMENFELIYKGNYLHLNKTLGEQNVMNKGEVRFTLINEEERRQMVFISRIMKGAALLAKRDEGFEEMFLNTTNHRGEMINLPKGEKAVFLTALILHEVARWNMKRKDYKQALVFLKHAENEFRLCTKELINCIDNYGVLHLDITWCYFQLQDPQCLKEAKERLEITENCFSNCFGRDDLCPEEMKDKSGRHKILYLRLQMLWGVWFFHCQMLDQSWDNFLKAEELLGKLQVDDLLVTVLVHKGYTTREARLALRATEGDVEEAEAYIEEKRQERKAAEKRRKERIHKPTSVAHSGGASAERNWTPYQKNQDHGMFRGDVQESPLDTNSSLFAGSRPPAGETSSAISTPAASAPTGAQSNPEEDEILRDILTYLPKDVDDYIDLFLEEEEAIVHEYKAKFKKATASVTLPDSESDKRSQNAEQNHCK
ncbi:NEDD8 ultimate buster 1-like [Narcine bancroftii]|uniref:NEDD8 ultimate buster 1-like n=1 Tax=Narcine bancroftii TaxID=1343680 RepID=UPI003831E125